MKLYDKTDKRNYRIFRVIVDSTDRHYDIPKKITMRRFYAKTLDDALVELAEYKKAANKEFTYYVEAWQPIGVIMDGKTYEIDENHREWLYDFSFLDEFKFKIRYWFYDFPRDIYFKCRNLHYLLKNKQEYSNKWNVDEALLDVLEKNIPSLLENKQSLSWVFLNQVILEKHKDEKDFDLDKFYRENYRGYGKDIEDEAIKRERDMLVKLLEDIKLYRYYMDGYSFVDKTDKEAIEFDKKWHHTLPLVKGSYDSYDYRVLDSMTNRLWNRIWATVQKYGREFND